MFACMPEIENCGIGELSFGTSSSKRTDLVVFVLGIGFQWQNFVKLTANSLHLLFQDRINWLKSKDPLKLKNIFFIQEVILLYFKGFLLNLRKAIWSNIPKLHMVSENPILSKGLIQTFLTFSAENLVDWRVTMWDQGFSYYRPTMGPSKGSTGIWNVGIEKYVFAYFTMPY